MAIVHCITIEHKGVSMGKIAFWIIAAIPQNTNINFASSTFDFSIFCTFNGLHM